MEYVRGELLLEAGGKNLYISFLYIHMCPFHMWGQEEDTSILL